MYKIHFLSHLLVLTFFSCSGDGAGSVFNSSELPENPDIIEIQWYGGGGMDPRSESIFLQSADSSVYSIMNMGDEQVIHFMVTDSEMHDLYQIFLENDFDLIRIIEEEVYDRGGTNIGLRADNFTVDKNNSGMQYIHEDDQDEYNAVEEKIYAFVMSKVSPMKVETTVLITENLLNAKYYFTLMVNNEYFIDTESQTALPEQTISLYKGVNSFEFSLSLKDSLDEFGYPIYHSFFDLPVMIKDSVSTVVFDFKNDSVLLQKR